MLHSVNFTAKKATALLATLQKLTVKLAKVGGEIVRLTEEFRAKSEQKSDGNIRH